MSTQTTLLLIPHRNTRLSLEHPRQASCTGFGRVKKIKNEYHMPMTFLPHRHLSFHVKCLPLLLDFVFYLVKSSVLPHFYHLFQSSVMFNCIQYFFILVFFWSFALWSSKLSFLTTVSCWQQSNCLIHPKTNYSPDKRLRDCTDNCMHFM